MISIKNRLRNVLLLNLIFWSLEILLLCTVGPQFFTLLLFITFICALGFLAAKYDLFFLFYPRPSKRNFYY